MDGYEENADGDCEPSDNFIPEVHKTCSLYLIMWTSIYYRQT